MGRVIELLQADGGVRLQQLVMLGAMDFRQIVRLVRRLIYRGGPAVGSVITFRYQGLSNAGVPRFPSFVRVCVLNAVSRITGMPCRPGSCLIARHS